MSEEPASTVAAPPPRRRARQGWALLFALLWPSGPGHLVIGYKRRAWAWAAAVAGFLLVAELATVASGSGRFMIAGLAGILAFHVLSAIDVWRLERSYPLPSVGAFLGQLVRLVGALAIFALGLRVTLVEAFKIPSGSMLPTLRVGDHIFVNKRVRHYVRGDVAVFDYPLDHSTSYIKRVIGLPGDVVELRNSVLKINGQDVPRRELAQPCTNQDGDPCKVLEESFEGRSWRISEDPVRTGDFPETTVPAGHYFVLGDNRPNSSDSRVWGFVDAELMRGTALSIWQSYKDDASFDWSRFNLPVR